VDSPINNPNRFKFKLFIFIITLFGTIAAFEAYCYLFRPHDTDHSSSIIPPYKLPRKSHVWQFEPNTGDKEIITDQDGLRSPKLNRPESYTARIGFIGASNLAGFRLDYSETLAGKLESRTGEIVANFSVCGYNTGSGLARLKKVLAGSKWPKLKVMVISYGVNDANHVIRPLWLASLNAVSWTTNYVGDFLGGLKQRWFPKYHPNVTLPEFTEKIEEIISLCRKYGIKPVLMTEPIPYHGELQAYRADLKRYIDRYPELHTYPYGMFYAPCLEGAKKMGWEQWFPTMPHLSKYHYLDYEQRMLEFANNGTPVLDTNRIIKTGNRDPREIFQKGYLGIYPDHCHLNDAGWELLVPKLSELLLPCL